MTYIDPSDMIRNPKPDDDALHLSDDPTMNDDYLFSASCNDMTGLTPTVAHSEDEAQNYEELFPYLPQIPPNPITGQPDVSPAEGIRAKMRTEVTRQHLEDDK